MAQLVRNKTYRLRDIVRYNRGLCIPIVHGCERVKPFLASRVPDLELDDVFFKDAFLRQERGADGRFFVVVELVVDETQDERGFSDGCFSEEDKFYLQSFGVGVCRHCLCDERESAALAVG